MTTSKISSKSPTIRRILREAQELSSSPSPDFTATPLDTDLFEWHFTLRGPPNSPYAAGIYHGRIVLPPAYPLKPPSFRFLTPSGRFETNREICLSISGHHEETWQPAWGLRTALVALRSFMETDVAGQVGGLSTTEAVRTRLAGESAAFRCAACGRTNKEILEESEEAARELEKEGKGGEEVVVPAELKMGFKDDMERERKEREARGEGEGEGTKGDLDEESAELAEGFVQTAPPGGGGSGGQPVLQPTRTVSSPNPQAQPQAQWAPQAPAQLRQAAGESSEWLDKLIMVLAVLLVAMLIKVLAA